jgi:hypothetical protein
VREHLVDPGWLDGLETRGHQAYAVLSMCRGLRTWRTGEHVSKGEAARWASEVLPSHAGLIGEALAWRARPGPPADGAATHDGVRGFVAEVQRLLA